MGDRQKCFLEKVGRVFDEGDGLDVDGACCLQLGCIKEFGRQVLDPFGLNVALHHLLSTSVIVFEDWSRFGTKGKSDCHCDAGCEGANPHCLPNRFVEGNNLRVVGRDYNCGLKQRLPRNRCSAYGENIASLRSSAVRIREVGDVGWKKLLCIKTWTVSITVGLK